MNSSSKISTCWIHIINFTGLIEKTAKGGAQHTTHSQKLLGKWGKMFACGVASQIHSYFSVNVVVVALNKKNTAIWWLCDSFRSRLPLFVPMRAQFWFHADIMCTDMLYRNEMLRWVCRLMYVFVHTSRPLLNYCVTICCCATIYRCMAMAATVCCCYTVAVSSFTSSDHCKIHSFTAYKDV